MGDKVRIAISAKTMEGLAAIDPEVKIDVVEIEPTPQQIAHVVIQDFSGSVVIEIPTPGTFPSWQVNAAFSRFDAGSGFVFQPRGNATPAHVFQCTRLPNRWTPVFAPLSSLASSRFDAFRKVLGVSNSVDLKNGQVVGDLNAKYDGMSGNAQVLAKAALLNLYAVLSDEVDPIGGVPWITYVRKVVRMDQERFLAEVDPTLFENVQTIINELASTYKAQGFFTESTAGISLHIPNIPTMYHSDANLVRIITIKKEYEQGNLQLTVSFLRVGGAAVHLLDCDMDEHRNIILHSFDVIQHSASGGTNP